MLKIKVGVALAVTAGTLVLGGCATSIPEPIAYTPGIPVANAQWEIVRRPTEPTTRVALPAWEALAEGERDRIRAAGTVEVLRPQSFGIVLDSQSVNESTPGTSGGAAVGGAIASAGYIDNSFRGRSYSATGHLAVGILGALVGSTLDAPPTAQFHTRYTVKLGDSEIKYFDEYKDSPFRHSLGVCVSVPDIALIGQEVCNQTVDSFRAKYLKAASP